GIRGERGTAGYIDGAAVGGNGSFDGYDTRGDDRKCPAIGVDRPGWNIDRSPVHGQSSGGIHGTADDDGPGDKGLAIRSSRQGVDVNGRAAQRCTGGEGKALTAGNEGTRADDVAVEGDRTG